MTYIKHNNFILEVKFSSNNIHIVASNKVRSEMDMKKILELVREAASAYGYVYKRTNKSWLTEWKAHNFLYDCNFQRERTGSVDLNEDEGKLRLLGYKALACLYRE